MRIHKNILLAKDVDGFLTDREGQILYSLAFECRGVGSIVEIGSWKGKSTIWLAQGVKDAKKKQVLYAIDPHVGSSEHQQENHKVWTYEEFLKNIDAANVTDIIHPIVKYSSEAIPDLKVRPIELLFIDGAHEYEFVAQDYKLFAPLVSMDGYVAFHDTPWPGVKQFIKEIFKSNELKNIYFVDTILLAQKTSSLSLKDKIKNRFMLGLHQQLQQACDSKAPKTFRALWKNWIKLMRDILYQL
ncbi:MAG: class I SAM-dependent methyltransferase [Candidatus Omnitrophica bacterium]|nr:class I SAM-dependent methyltransferase [Candidatus Omnitrophota bacterium]